MKTAARASIHLGGRVVRFLDSFQVDGDRFTAVSSVRPGGNASFIVTDVDACVYVLQPESITTNDAGGMIIIGRVLVRKAVGEDGNAPAA